MFVAVNVPSLDALTLKGDGNITVTGINSRDLTVVLPGSGNIQATGTTTRLDVTISGEGTVASAPADRARRESGARWRRHHHAHRDAQPQRERLRQRHDPL